MLASSSDQISSFPFMNQSTSLEKSIPIHDEIENPISRFEQNHPPSLQFIDCYNYNYNFNPFLDEEFILGHILYSQKQQFLGTNFGHEIGLESANNTNEEKTQKASSQKKAKTDHISTKKPISGKRSSNKDRHSKICTSKGPRDRRMRLSLEIARSFFDLQDMLGFDKASKTVEWLFSKSRSAIKELKEKYLSEANCNNQSNNNDSRSSDFASLVGKVSGFEEVPREKKRRKLRIVDKESRYKARARARERTRAKLIRRLEKSKSDFEGNPAGVCKMGDVLEESGTKSKMIEYQQTRSVSHSENEEILGSKGEKSASLIRNQCESKVVSKEMCSDEVHLPGSSMDGGTVSLDNMKASPAGNFQD